MYSNDSLHPNVLINKTTNGTKNPPNPEPVEAADSANALF